GGMATGGLVILIPFLTDGTEQQVLAGLMQEMVERLDVRKAALYPKKEEWGSSDEQKLRYWRRRGTGSYVSNKRVRYSVTVDPEILKCVLNDMVEEAGVKIYLHSWASRAIAEENKVQGMIFESKSGRQAILSNITIDCTGDGDMFASVGAEFDATIDRSLRTANMALPFRLGNVDAEKYVDFRDGQPEKHTEMMKELLAMGGFETYWRTTREDIFWCNNRLRNLNCIDVEDITFAEISGRKAMLISLDYLRKNVPGFENCYIVDTCSQIGTRGSRRLKGVHTLTWEEVTSGVIHEDAVVISSHLGQTVSKEYPLASIPYRSLVPQKVDNLLVAGRCFSSDAKANNDYNWIQQCIPMGQAAGTAAALAIKGGLQPRQVDHVALQERLLSQGAALPGVKKAAKT
ncbi:MAG TPA: FAD-dependent oxidoreductase, partial [Dehalococcoidales bacterium]|nr:FAD-dependent oxidoreductase [Dehalococcoidales bacterium]